MPDEELAARARAVMEDVVRGAVREKGALLRVEAPPGDV